VSEAAAEWVETGVLKPWARNPRKLDHEHVKRVAQSIEQFGFGAPIVARRETGEIIAGHTRWRAAQKLELALVPVRYLDITDDAAHKLALADNRLGELAEWDTPELHKLLAEYSSTDIEVLGWTDKEIAKIERLARADVASELAEDEVPETPQVAVTQPGDTWQLGDHRLLCGDCRDARTIAALMGEQRANVAITSPPYASQRDYDESAGFKPIPPSEYVAWFEAVQRSVGAVLAADGSWFVNIKEHCADGERELYVKDLTIAHVREWGWKLVDELCWVRLGVPGGWPNRFKNAWEPVFHFARQAAIKFRSEHVLHESVYAFDYSPSYPKSGSGSGLLSGNGTHRHQDGLARPSNVISVPNRSDVFANRHEAVFPVGLPGFFLRAYADKGDVVLDPFVGSGTTIIAAERLERVAFGVEISPRYCDVVVERWESLTGQKAVRV